MKMLEKMRRTMSTWLVWTRTAAELQAHADAVGEGEFGRMHDDGSQGESGTAGRGNCGGLPQGGAGARRRGIDGRVEDLSGGDNC
jgi:hypothetical protein